MLRGYFCGAARGKAGVGGRGGKRRAETSERARRESPRRVPTMRKGLTSRESVLIISRVHTAAGGEEEGEGRGELLR